MAKTAIETSAKNHSEIRPLAWVALTASLLTALPVWFAFVAGAEIFGGLPAWARDGEILAVLIYVLPVDLILITWAGSRGGTNHVLSVIALVILFSPILPFVL